MLMVQGALFQQRFELAETAVHVADDNHAPVARVLQGKLRMNHRGQLIAWSGGASH